MADLTKARNIQRIVGSLVDADPNGLVHVAGLESSSNPNRLLAIMCFELADALAATVDTLVDTQARLDRVENLLRRSLR